MQDALFPESEGSPATRPALKRVSAAKVRPAAPDPAHIELAAALPSGLRLGTSSWNYPGWTGTVWADAQAEATLSKHGLTAYAKHPLFRTVSVDRGFYRALSVGQYAHCAAQVPEGFRFVVKAPALVTDALVRREDGRGMQPNSAFLDAALALRHFVQPALEGLGPKLGALVFQLSPLPPGLLARMPEVLHRLEALLLALPALQPAAPEGVIAVEVRDPEFLTPAFVEVLRRAGAIYCLGLHPKLPPIAEQLPMLRALWPGPLVCRWNLNRRHGAYGYEDAKKLYAPFDRIVDPDPDTRDALARVIAGTTGAGHLAYVTLSNKAEGSAPHSVLALAQAVRDHAGGAR